MKYRIKEKEYRETFHKTYIYIKLKIQQKQKITRLTKPTRLIKGAKWLKITTSEKNTVVHTHTHRHTVTHIDAEMMKQADCNGCCYIAYSLTTDTLLSYCYFACDLAMLAR